MSGPLIGGGNLKTFISVVASYNSSDWTYGWVSMLDGFSIFVNSEMGTGLFKFRNPWTLTMVSDQPGSSTNRSGSGAWIPGSVNLETYWQVSGA